jgi:glutathione S-transferase
MNQRMSQTHHLKLVSFELCPFVERSRIALAEKKLAHDVQFIDLKAKPDWFLAISPMGKVPVLLVDDRPIFESLVINELIEELYPSPRLLPVDPLARAEARAWMIFANDQLMLQSYKAQVAMAVGRPGEADEAVAAVRSSFGKLEAQLKKRSGRFFLSDEFSLVDAAYAPFFRRWLAAEGWGELKLLKEFPALAAYAETLSKHPSVAEVAIPNLSDKLRAAYRERAAK